MAGFVRRDVLGDAEQPVGVVEAGAAIEILAGLQILRMKGWGMANVEYVQTNVNLTIEDARALDLMAAEMGIDNRSAFVRWLVRQEFARRYSRPNQVSVGEALAAGKEVAE